MGLDGDVEGDDQAALEVHPVDHVPDLFEHALVGHDHLLAEGAAHLEQAEGRGPPLGDGLFRAAVVPEQFNGLKCRQHERVAARREGGRIPFEVDDLLDRQVRSVVHGGLVFGELADLDELAIRVLHFHGHGIDADEFVDVLPRFGVAFEADGIALYEQLEDHVLHEP